MIYIKKSRLRAATSQAGPRGREGTGGPVEMIARCSRLSSCCALCRRSALSRRCAVATRCLLAVKKQTSRSECVMSANDPLSDLGNCRPSPPLGAGLLFSMADEPNVGNDREELSERPNTLTTSRACTSR